MKQITRAFGALLLSATATLAGSPEPAPVPAPVAPVAAPAADWAGFYGGLSYSSTDVDNAGRFNSSFGKATSLGAFAGYNWQRGQLIYGGEIAYQDSLGDRANRILSEPAAVLKGEENLSAGVDLRARIGYDLGRMMVYGLLGYSQATFNIADQSPTLNGHVLGAGAAVRVTDRVFAGVEATRRDLSGQVFGRESSFDVTTVTVRLGMQF